MRAGVPTRRVGLLRGAQLAAVALAAVFALQSAASGYWYMYARQWVFHPDDTPTVGLSAYGPEAIALEVYKVDPKAFDTPNWPSELRQTGSRIPGKMLKRWMAAPPSQAKGRYGSWSVVVPTEGTGIYAVIAKREGRERRAIVAVTDTALVAKQSGTKLSAWVTDIVSGKPVEGRTVRVQRASPPDEGDETQPPAPQEAATNSDGLADFQEVARGTNLVSIRSGDSVAFCYTYTEVRSERDQVYLYTERPVYRPKQKVYFKGVARRDRGHEWETLAGEDVDLVITDPEGDEILTDSYTTNEFGSFAGEMELSAGPLLGRYTLQAALNESSSYAHFYVEEYRKPEFRVRAQTPQNVYFPGDKVEFSVEASYYFGAPVADAHVRYYVYSGYHWAGREPESEFEDIESEEPEQEEYYGYGELLYEGEAVTGPDGIALVTVDAKRHDTTRRYHIDARVTDRSRREVRGYGSCVVAPAQIRPFVWVDRWITKPGERIAISIDTFDLLREAGARCKVEISIRSARWTKTLKGNTERWEQLFKEVSAHTAETDSEGKGRLQVPAPTEDGSYQVLATVRDEKARAATDTAWFRVAAPGERSRWVERETLRIETDKSRYRPGDTARIVVTGSKPDAYVLFTVEGYDLFECSVKRLLGYSAYFEIAIKEEYKPNIYFRACSVREMAFADDSSGVRVSPTQKFLTVQVSPDKESYGPGETARYTLCAIDPTGDPVSAEVSLGIVDEAIYAIRPDQTPDVRKFFYASRRNSVRTSHSFAQQYAGGAEKGEPEEVAEGEVEVRRRFEDTAYWNPFIVTDASGRATVSFELPDNLTTWRATAIAATTDTAVGYGRQRQVVTKPLVARLITPRFLVQGDEVTISGIVHNYTNKAQDVSVTLESEGADLIGAAGKRTAKIEPEGHERFEWSVTAQRPTTATFSLKAIGTDAADAIALSLPVNPFGVRQVEAFSARAASETSRIFWVPKDATEGTAGMQISLSPSLGATVLASLRKLAKYPYGCIEQTMSGFLPDVLLSRAMRDLGLKDDWLDANLGDMIEVGFSKIYSKQLDTGAWGWSAHDDADGYWTNYVVYGLLMAQKAGFEVKEDRLNRGLAALREVVSGAPGDLKPEVLHTLSIAEGTKWHEHAVRALKTVHDAIEGQDKGRGVGEIDSSLAFLTLAFANMGDKVRAGECCALLSERAKATVDTANWGAREQPHWYYGTQNTETTAWALRALLAADPKSALIPKAVKWLMQQRTDRGWRSTKDSCAVLMAMIDYLSATRELSADYIARVRVNGDEIGLKRFTRDDLFKPELVLDVDPDLLRPGANVVTVRKDGEGTLYWAGVLEYHVPADRARGHGRGLKIEKLYLKAEAVRKKARWGWHWDWEYSSARDGVEPGDLVYCKLVIRSDQPREYVLIADPIPAGCEFHKEESDYGYWWWDWWYGQREYHDDHIAFLSSSLERGKNVITYYMRAETPGEFHVSPAELEMMYAPEIRANSREIALEIRD